MEGLRRASVDNSPFAGDPFNLLPVGAKVADSVESTMPALCGLKLDGHGEAGKARGRWWFTASGPTAEEIYKDLATCSETDPRLRFSRVPMEKHPVLR